MSNTRHVKPGEPLTQQGFCSSVECHRGLLGHIVAGRYERLERPEDRELVMALQYYSWQPGGFTQVAQKVIARFRGRIITPSMQRFGVKPNQIYTASQVKAVREEMESGSDWFPLAGEIPDRIAISLPEVPSQAEDPLDHERPGILRHLREVQDHANAQPKAYPAEAFIRVCLDSAARELPGYLSRLCVDPELDIAKARPWWFPDLISSLREWLAERGADSEVPFVQTEIAGQVHEALDYCLKTGEMTMIYGESGTGKSDGAKAWFQRQPGKGRYLEVPATGDDISFIRRIGEAYRTISGTSLRNPQTKERVEKTARAAGMVLILDEGHNLLTQDYRARKRPSRISWVMGELVNYGVPVAILATRQFEEDKRRIKERTGWNWDQFDRRIGIPTYLPSEVRIEDLTAVARAWLPRGDDRSIKALVGYAMFSKSRLAGIVHVVKRAKFEADKAGRPVVFADIQSAIERRLPVDPEANPAVNHHRPERRRSSFSPLPRRTVPRPFAPKATGDGARETRPPAAGSGRPTSLIPAGDGTGKIFA
jgi:hypothetical protein